MRHATWCASLFGLALISTIAAAPAHAQATRTWVSSVGNDVNPCTRTVPCKTFAGAILKTATGGEINVLDPGDYGAVTITKSITIDGSGGSVAGVAVAGTNGITINDSGAGTVVVTLRNLDIEGLGFAPPAAPGLRGISFLSGASLHVQRCIIRNFRDSGVGTGISFTPSTSAKLFVEDTVLSGNGIGFSGGGIIVQPSGGASARVSLIRVNIENNVTGFGASGLGSSGGINVSIDDSVSSGNLVGFFATTPVGGAPTKVMINRSTSANNGIGLSAIGAGTILRIGNSIVTGNITGVQISNSATMTSFGTNEINDNAALGQSIPIVGPT